MAEKTIEELLREHRFFREMKPEYLDLIAGCGRNVHFGEGEFVARQGGEAKRFYAIRKGRVALQIASPERGALTVQTVGEGEVLGWSWLFAPYEWEFDAQTVEPVSAVEFDGVCLREKCEKDPVMGYDFMKRFAGVFVKRLEATRLQLMDLYHPV